MQTTEVKNVGLENLGSELGVELGKGGKEKNSS